jgi:hypothetical protein
MSRKRSGWRTSLRSFSKFARGRAVARTFVQAPFVPMFRWLGPPFVRFFILARRRLANCARGGVDDDDSDASVSREKAKDVFSASVGSDSESGVDESSVEDGSGLGEGDVQRNGASGGDVGSEPVVVVPSSFRHGACGEEREKEGEGERRFRSWHGLKMAIGGERRLNGEFLSRGRAQASSSLCPRPDRKL